ncbi:MAG: poly-beta-hydroxybutyrate polymerase N-terminal domain-containing protein, partial [Pseudomonadota bacterium]
MKHVLSPDLAITTNVDSVFHAAIGRLTGGLSPAALATAYLDWSMHLAGSPRKQADLAWAAYASGFDMARAIGCALGHEDPACGQRRAADKRFRDPAWNAYPFNLISHAFLLQQDWWEAATSALHGVEPAHARITQFMARQTLDMLSPANFWATNPVVVARTQAEMGQNLVRGAQNWLTDLDQLLPHLSLRSRDDNRIGGPEVRGRK